MGFCTPDERGRLADRVQTWIARVDLLERARALGGATADEVANAREVLTLLREELARVDAATASPPG